jgi:hypothetical protein
LLLHDVGGDVLFWSLPDAGNGQASATAEQADILSHLSIVSLEGDQGIPYKTIRIEAVNLQLVNGLGNLLIGYNDPKPVFLPPLPAGNDYRGSHNLVLGAWNSYSSFGGIVGGLINTISGAHSSVLTGDSNFATAQQCVVASAAQNSAGGLQTLVGTGTQNVTSGTGTMVATGVENAANGPYASVSGGNPNTATGSEASVSGGFFNLASGQFASISGGNSRGAAGTDDWVAGTLLENN